MDKGVILLLHLRQHQQAGAAEMAATMMSSKNAAFAGRAVGAPQRQAPVATRRASLQVRQRIPVLEELGRRTGEIRAPRRPVSAQLRC
jgi:hypothetical protein